MGGKYYLILLLLISLPAMANDQVDFQFLNFDEITAFSQNDSPNPSTVTTLNKTLGTVFYGKAKQHPNKLRHNKELNHDYFRVTHWNIERGFNLEQIAKAMKRPELYLKENIDSYINEKESNEIKSQIEALRKTDIFTLNEVDWGISRTDYKNIAKEFANLINGDYAFAAEFLEVSPNLLDTVDKPKQYKGLHGNAIVSRYPIKEARILRLPLCYDWFKDEKKRLGIVEAARRTSSKITIKEEIITEIRQGSRIALIAEVTLPNKQNVTIVSTHLENRTQPQCRERQMKAILESIQNINNPLILAGDLNNFEKSAEPTSLIKIIGNRILDPTFLGKAVFNYLNPYGLITNATSFTLGSLRKYKDPTVTNIPILLPNKSYKLFNIIEDFEFADANKFNFSSNKDLSYQSQSGQLSTSNQRGSKGFIDTFKFQRAFGIAYYKIDWLFVKPKGRQCIPAFGRTLKELNYRSTPSLSDHSPVTVEVIVRR